MTTPAFVIKEDIHRPALSTDSQSDVISILFLVDQLTELGGGERILLQIAELLPPRFFRVTIVAFRSQPHPLTQTLPLDIRILPIARTWSIDGLRAARALRAIIREREVTLVHTFFETADIYGALVARCSGVRSLVSSRRDMGILRRRKHRISYQLMTPLYSRILTVSNQVRDMVIATDRVPPSKVVTIYNGVRPSIRKRSDVDIRARYKLPENLPLITTVANLQRWKGVDNFLRAAAVIHSQRPTARFVIAGEWTDTCLTRELFALRTHLGLDHCVYFLGNVDNVPALLEESSVFCLLSDSEGFPNVVLEAMNAGTPVVATAVGGTPEAIEHDVSGYLVPRGDFTDAAHHVIDLLDSPARRRSISGAARSRVHGRFSAEAMLAHYIDIYRQLSSPAYRFKN